MTELSTLRIYFPHGRKINDQSFWQKLKSSDYATELIKRAKAFNIDQAINFNVSKGYLTKSKLCWGNSEIKAVNHPQVIELTGKKEKIYSFLEQEDSFLKGTDILLVLSEVAIEGQRD